MRRYCVFSEYEVPEKKKKGTAAPQTATSAARGKVSTRCQFAGHLLSSCLAATASQLTTVNPGLKGQFTWLGHPVVVAATRTVIEPSPLGKNGPRPQENKKKQIGQQKWECGCRMVGAKTTSTNIDLLHAPYRCVGAQRERG